MAANVTRSVGLCIQAVLRKAFSIISIVRIEIIDARAPLWSNHRRKVEDQSKRHHIYPAMPANPHGTVVAATTGEKSLLPLIINHDIMTRSRQWWATRSSLSFLL